MFGGHNSVSFRALNSQPYDRTERDDQDFRFHFVVLACCYRSYEQKDPVVVVVTPPPPPRYGSGMKRFSTLMPQT